MEAYMWLILISMLAVGVLFGFVIGRSKGDVSAPRVRELEKDLHDAREEMQGYRTQVTAHFEQTATLFNRLTQDYRDVYEHLAKSSNQLCGSETARLKGLSADKGLLEGHREPSPKDDAGQPKAEETKAADDTPASREDSPEKTPAASGAAPASDDEPAKEASKKSEEVAATGTAKTPADEAARTIH